MNKIEHHNGRKVIFIAGEGKCSECIFYNEDCTKIPCSSNERSDRLYGHFVDHQEDEVFSDDAAAVFEKPPTLANAASIVIETLDGKSVLTATRRDTSILALPGGKQDPGETILDTIVREVKEETGFNINPTLCVPVYSSIIEGADGCNFYCTTYLYQARFNEEHFMPAWQVEKGITVSFKKWDDLLANGAFSGYNNEVKKNVDVARKSIPVL